MGNWGGGVEGRGSKQKETDGSRKTQRYRALTDERREREGERDGEREGGRERESRGWQEGDSRSFSSNIREQKMLKMTCMKLSDIYIDMSSVTLPGYQRLRSSRHARRNVWRSIKLTMSPQLRSRCSDKDRKKATQNGSTSTPTPPYPSPSRFLTHHLKGAVRCNKCINGGRKKNL